MKKYFLRVLKKTGLLTKLNIKPRSRYNNKTFKIPIINGLGYENIFLKSNWLDLLIAAFCNSENQLFIDVGVNLGQSLIRVKSFNDKIKYIGFEPNVACCYYVGKLIDLNSLKNVSISHTALFSNPGYLVLNKDYDHDLRGTVIANQRPGMFSVREKVFGIAYDEYFGEEEITFVKLDVEGAESEVLQGMKKSISKHRPVIVCEILDSHSPEVSKFTQMRANVVVSLIHELNYRIFNLKTDHNEERIIMFNEIDHITIKQWTTASSCTNDYLFLPFEKHHLFKELLRNLNLPNN